MPKKLAVILVLALVANILGAISAPAVALADGPVVLPANTPDAIARAWPQFFVYDVQPSDYVQLGETMLGETITRIAEKQGRHRSFHRLGERAGIRPAKEREGSGDPRASLL